MAAIFACIVQPKVIEFGSDQKLHRAQKDEELRSELEALKLPSPEEKPAGPDGAAAPTAHWPGQGKAAPHLCHPGGGCRLLLPSASVSVATVGSAVCVFEGALLNAGTLAEDYAPVPEDEPITAPTALTCAELMCHMYAKVGVEMLGLLRGSFTFVLYESKTSRVLAARDGGGRCQLFQARTNKGSLVLSNNGDLLDESGCTEKLEFMPGEFKYGWSATPRRYQPGDHARLSRRSLDLPGSAHHQHPHQHHVSHFHVHHHPLGQSPSQNSSRNGSRRSSLDHHQPQEAASTGVGAGADVNGAQGGGRQHHRNQQHGNQHHQQPQANGGGSGSPSPQQKPGSHPHRTYVVTAEESRVIKSPPARPAAEGPAGAPAGVWTAVASRPNKEKGQGQENGGSHGRGGSGRGASSDHNRRRSLDNHGAWRLGACNGVSAFVDPKQKQQQAGSGGEQQQQQTGLKQTGVKQTGLQQTGQKQGQQQQPGTTNGGRVRQSRDGRQSADGRTPVKQQQQPNGKVGPASTGAAATAAASPAVSGSILRVDAPEFVCTRSVAAVPVAVAAVIRAP